MVNAKTPVNIGLVKVVKGESQSVSKHRFIIIEKYREKLGAKCCFALTTLTTLTRRSRRPCGYHGPATPMGASPKSQALTPRTAGGTRNIARPNPVRFGFYNFGGFEK
jgi:hypothetical protein